MDVRVACFGDVVGSSGRAVLKEFLPGYIRDKDIHLVVANGENLAAGSGLTPSTYREVMASGVDVMTTGDHVYRKADGIPLLDKERSLLRPANYPVSAAGRGHMITTASNGVEVGVVNLVGRVFLGPAECPFLAGEKLVDRIRQQTPLVLVDFHGEATSEKIAMGWFLDGRASAVFGTHTHVQTADEVILPGGTGYITDLGMTGPHQGVIGRQVRPVVKKFITNMPAPFKESKEWGMAKGALFTLDHGTGKCLAVERIVLSAPGSGPTLVRGGL